MKALSNSPYLLRKATPLLNLTKMGIRRAFTKEIELTVLRGQMVSKFPHLICMSMLPGISDHL